jgi:hypothetical protein
MHDAHVYAGTASSADMVTVTKSAWRRLIQLSDAVKLITRPSR